MIFRFTGTEGASTCAGLLCDAGGPAAPTGIIWLLSVGLTMLLTVGYVQDGIETCQEEREYLLAEREAFQAFRDRVQSIEPVVTDPPAEPAADLSEPPHTTLLNTDPGDATLKDVLAAYNETVQSLPHYREEYNETLAESLAAELGQDIVTALATNKVLVPATQRVLIERSQQAIDSRTNLAEAITAEIDALTDAKADLDAIETRRQTLRAHLDTVERNRSEAAFDVFCTLHDLEAEVDAIAQQRQETLQNAPVQQVGTATNPADDDDFYEYLHGIEGTPRYPVLSAVAELVSAIRTDREQVAEYL